MAPLTAALSAEDIPWDPAPLARPGARPLLLLVAELLPALADDLAADLIEHTAITLADSGEELRAVRSVLSAALERAHTLHVENIRLRQHLADLRGANRQRPAA